MFSLSYKNRLLLKKWYDKNAVHRREYLRDKNKTQFFTLGLVSFGLTNEVYYGGRNELLYMEDVFSEEKGSVDISDEMLQIIKHHLYVSTMSTSTTNEDEEEAEEDASTAQPQHIVKCQFCNFTKSMNGFLDGTENIFTYNFHSAHYDYNPSCKLWEDNGAAIGSFELLTHTDQSLQTEEQVKKFNTLYSQHVGDYRYSTFTSRLNTFFKRTTPIMMFRGEIYARCGLVYTGIDELCICFYCCNIIDVQFGRKWKDVNKTHRIKNPRCAFLKLIEENAIENKDVVVDEGGVGVDDNCCDEDGDITTTDEERDDDPEPPPSPVIPLHRYCLYCGKMNIIKYMFLPCRHFVACKSCVKQFKKCPCCERHIDNTLKILFKY